MSADPARSELDNAILAWMREPVWDYDEENRKEAIEISHQFLARRLDFLKNPPKKKTPPKKKPLPKKK